MAVEIGGYAPFGTEENAHLERIVRWLSEAPQPLERNCFTPGHAVGSAFVVSTSGSLALVYHSKLKRWLQPGGHAEPGECHLWKVAAREAQEELGIRIAQCEPPLFDVEVQRIPARRLAPQHLHFDLRFLCVVDRVELAPASDAETARWFSRSEALALDPDRGLRRMVDKASARGLLSG